jgi:DNA-binding response OmpR family regulator
MTSPFFFVNLEVTLGVGNQLDCEEDGMEKIILVVEDTPFYGTLLVYVLSHQALYQTRLVQTGRQALLLAREIIPLLFLLDYRLPDMTGLALFDQLHRGAGQEMVPALLLSADLPNRELEAQLSFRKIRGMSKPFKTDDLLLTIEQLVRK